MREALGEIDGLVLAFIGLTVIMSLSALLMKMTLAWRMALGLPLAAMLALLLLRRRKKGDA